MATWTPGLTPREAVLTAFRAVIMPEGEPDGILFRGVAVSSIGVTGIRVTGIVVNGHCRLHFRSRISLFMAIPGPRPCPTIRYLSRLPGEIGGGSPIDRRGTAIWDKPAVVYAYLVP